MSARPIFSDGAAYERTMGRWSARVGTTFLDWLGQPPALRWLDVGCGNGAFTELIATRQSPVELHGVDPSEPQLAYARTRPALRAARFVQGDAVALPYDAQAFDAAAMALVIVFVSDAPKAVGEMARVVRPGGCVATYMWDFLGGGAPPDPLFRAMRSVGLPSPIPPTAAVASLDRLRALWEGAGLASVATQKITIQIEYDDFNDFWNTVSTPSGPSGKAVAELPAPERERVRNVLDETVARTADGRIVYEAWANAVKGTVPSA